MEMQLRRTTFTNRSAVGELWIDGQFECYTLEDQVREIPGQPVASWKVHGKTAIPTGIYSVVINFSSRFHRPLPLLIGVPGFSGIRIHSGNTDKDTEGCILVGQENGSDFIGNSRAAFDVLMLKLRAALDMEKVKITISGLPEVKNG